MKSAATTTSNRPRLFTVHGPFDVPVVKNGHGPGFIVDGAKARVAFWEKVGVHEGSVDISDKDGVYIYAMRLAKGFTPWYVGKASRSLKSEVFQSHKIEHVNKVVSRRGSLVLFFITRADPKKKSVGGAILNRLETDLIRFAGGENPKLLNTNKKIDNTKWYIKGIGGGQGRPSAATGKFKAMMGRSNF